MNAALVPVKPLAAAKSRLAGALPREALERLGLAMLGDLVAALRAVPGLARVAVATPDPRVAREAEALGAEALLRDDPGLNAALDGAARELATARGGPGLEALLVVLGDVPGAAPAELASMFDALRSLGGRGVVLAPSRDGGTSALLRAPFDAISNRFGPDSAAAHRAAAREAGVPLRELALPSLAVDLDRPEDALALLAGPGAPRTRALLAELRIGAELGA
jgi:2-phospho-L-lactate guanylyltransferase